MEINKTINSICSNCGDCCCAYPTVSAIEVKTIKKYIKDNNTKELIHKRNGRLESICTFRNREDKKCNIYEVRPEICRLFICSGGPLGITKEDIERIRLTSSYNISPHPHKSFHEIFYDNTDWVLNYKKETE